MLHEDGEDVTFDVVDGEEGLAEGEGEGFGIGDADEQGAGEAGAGGDGDGVEVLEGDAGAGDGLADDGDDVAEVLAAGELGDDAAIEGVEVDLAGDDGREGLRAFADDGGGGLVAGGFNAEDQAVTHTFHGTCVPGLSLVREALRAHHKGMASEGQSAAYKAALEVVEVLRGAGHQAYFAGGCVRDLLLGVEPKDFDVATSARPEQVQALFRRTEAVGAHFGVVLVIVSGEGDRAERRAIEVATFRHDGAYTDGRRPDAVRFSDDPREDVLRRDFTINGMLLDAERFRETGEFEGSVLDFVGGREDLRAGVVRAIGDPAVRFAEDKLRTLRGVRFAARLGFALDGATAEAMRAAANEIAQVSAERVRDELTRMLTEGRARRAMELLDEVGLLAQVLPEAVRMHGVEQPPDWHPEGDVWTHTMLLLEKLQAGCPATLAWGALLHDIGKPATFQIDRSGKGGHAERIRFSGHVEVGVRIAETICNRLRFSNEDTAQIVALVRHHMRFGDVPAMREATVKRFLRLPKFDEHLRLHWLDCSSCHGRLGIWEEMTQRYHEEPAKEVRPALLVTGRELIDAGYRPGPRFKEMLETAEDAQLEGAVRSTDEAMKLVRARFGEPKAAVRG